jgi:hypothetical protein
MRSTPASRARHGNSGDQRPRREKKFQLRLPRLWRKPSLQTLSARSHAHAANAGLSRTRKTLLDVRGAYLISSDEPYASTSVFYTH